VSIVDRVIEFFKTSKNIAKREDSPTLFNVREYERPGYTNYKKCPNCGIEADNNKEIKNLFGLMNVGGHIYSQSWCKQCRKVSAQKKR
tara:strand:+ start:162 stop:425 length:264 start_codon:yes stop_codon:yes gene_type:complete